MNMGRRSSVSGGTPRLNMMLLGTKGGLSLDSFVHPGSAGSAGSLNSPLGMLPSPQPPPSPRKLRTAAERAGALASRFDGMVKEQVVLGGIMGKDAILSVWGMRAKISGEAQAVESWDDLFALLELKEQPVAGDDKKRLIKMMSIPKPHSPEQAEVDAASREELGSYIAAAINVSRLEELHSGGVGISGLVEALGLKAKDSDGYVKFEGKGGRIAKEEGQEEEVKSPKSPRKPKKKKSPFAATSAPSKLKAAMGFKSGANSPRQRERKTSSSEEDGVTSPKSPRSGAMSPKERVASMTASIDQQRLAEKTAQGRALREEARKLQEAKTNHLYRLKDLSKPKIYTTATESPNLVGDSWSMWSAYGNQYDNARPEPTMEETSFKEDTMSAAKGVYYLGERATAVGGPGRKRRYFRQTDTTSIIGFPDGAAGSTDVDPAEVVGSWQWGRPKSERSEAKGVTRQKWQALAPPAFVGKIGVSAEEAVFDAIRREWVVVRSTPALPRAEGSEDAAMDEEGWAHPRGAPALVRHEAVVQLIAEGARLAELSPKTQRRLCRLRPLRMSD